MESLEELEETRRRGKTNTDIDRNPVDISLKKKLHLQKNSRHRAIPKGMASNEMCTFLILNISSIQLIPVNIIACRAQYGSVNPAAIVGPGILATAVSTGVAVIFCKAMDQGKSS